MNAGIWIIETTLDEENRAHELATQAVESGLAACAQVDSPITSYYTWEGKLERSQELRVHFKLAGKSRQAFTQWLLDHHPYACPQVLAWPVESGNPEYSDWVLNT